MYNTKSKETVFYDRLRKTYKEFSDNYKVFILFIENMNSTLEELKNMPSEITYKINYIEKENLKSDISTQNTAKFETQNSVDVTLGVKYKLLNSKLQSINKITGSYSSTNSNVLTNEKQSEIKVEETKVAKREKLLNELIEPIAYLFNEYKELINKDLSIYLDDFYQIHLDKQVRIIQYLHNIYINCSDGSFCFKLCTLPNRLKLNYDNENILSPKDNFSTINLDRDLSEIDAIKQYLLQILCSIKKGLNIKPRDIDQIFSTDALLTLILASGGIPRDFLIMFTDAINNARANNDVTVGKSTIYDVVNSMRKDKDENIEFDADITQEMLESAKQQIGKEIIESKNTNIFLFSHNASENDIALMRNLVNARYLHVIKESTSSENRKKEMFTAYLVDMSFYINGKQKKRGFEDKPFWQRDDRSRLKHIESAPIFKFKV